MKRTRSKFITCVILAAVFGIMAESCGSSKKCGCGTDIMGVYKPHRKHRYS